MTSPHDYASSLQKALNRRERKAADLFRYLADQLPMAPTSRAYERHLRELALAEEDVRRAVAMPIDELIVLMHDDP